MQLNVTGILVDCSAGNTDKNQTNKTITKTEHEFITAVGKSELKTLLIRDALTQDCTPVV